MKNNLFLILITLLIHTSCTKDQPITPDPQLPEITMTGEDTFGCLVNGELWLPEGPFNPLSSNPDAKYDESNGFLQLTAQKLNDAANSGEILHLYVSFLVQANTNLKIFQVGFIEIF